MIETTNQTKLFGILGTPISHTLSPAMHSYLAKKCGIDMAYLAFDVASEFFDRVMCGAKAMGASGFNITAPHKIRVMEHLDVVCPDAKIMDSVNTVVSKNDVWHGYNTDGDGFCGSLLLEGCEIFGKDILMMGAGGSARSLCYKLAKNGARSITITSRSADKVRVIGDMVEQHTETKFYDFVDNQKEYDIVINTTPVGMHPLENDNPCTFLDKIHAGMFCCDIIYNPAKTLFLKAAEERGANVINGLGMLVLQGILAFEHFCDVTLDRAACYNELTTLFQAYKI